MNWGVLGKLRSLVNTYEAKARYNIETANAYDKEGAEGKHHATKFRRMAQFLEGMAADVRRIVEDESCTKHKIYLGVDYGTETAGFIVYSDEVGVLMYGDTLIQAFDAFCDALEAQIEGLVERPRESVHPGRAMDVREKLSDFPKHRIFDEPTKKFHSSGNIMKQYTAVGARTCPHCNGVLGD